MKQKIMLKLVSCALVIAMLIVSVGIHRNSALETYAAECESEYLQTEIEGIFIKDEIKHVFEEGKYTPIGSLAVNLLDQHAMESVLADNRLSDSMKQSITEKIVAAENGEIYPNIEIYSFDLLPQTRAYINEGPYNVGGTRMKSEWMTYLAMPRRFDNALSGTSAITKACSISSLVFSGASMHLGTMPITSATLGIFSIFLDGVGGIISDYNSAYGNRADFIFNFDVTEKNTLVETFYGSNVWEYKLLTNRLYIKRVTIIQSYYNSRTNMVDVSNEDRNQAYYVLSESFADPYERCKTIGSGPIDEHVWVMVDGAKFFLI